MPSRLAHLLLPLPFLVHPQANARPRPDPAQSVAVQTLLAQHTTPVAPGLFRVCNPFPSDPRLLNALKYADDKTMVQLDGLPGGLKALPAGLYRETYCLPPRPDPKRPGGLQNLAMWYQNFMFPRDGAGPATTPAAPRSLDQLGTRIGGGNP